MGPGERSPGETRYMKFTHPIILSQRLKKVVILKDRSRTTGRGVLGRSEETRPILEPYFEAMSGGKLS